MCVLRPLCLHCTHPNVVTIRIALFFERHVFGQCLFLSGIVIVTGSSSQIMLKAFDYPAMYVVRIVQGVASCLG
jgi:hypothetical protein